MSINNHKTSGAVVIPNKSSINLAAKEKNKGAFLIGLGGVVGVALVVVLFAKFGVIDQQARLEAAQKKYDEAYAENEKAKEYIATYDDVLSEYHSITLSTTSDDEEAKLDRGEMLDVIENEIIGNAIIDSLQLVDNTISLSMSDITLVDVSEIMEKFLKYPIVKSATINSATTDEEKDGNVLSEVTITVVMHEAEEETEGEQ